MKVLKVQEDIRTLEKARDRETPENQEQRDILEVKIRNYRAERVHEQQVMENRVVKLMRREFFLVAAVDVQNVLIDHMDNIIGFAMAKVNLANTELTAEGGRWRQLKECIRINATIAIKMAQEEDKQIGALKEIHRQKIEQEQRLAEALAKPESAPNPLEKIRMEREAEVISKEIEEKLAWLAEQREEEVRAVGHLWTERIGTLHQEHVRLASELKSLEERSRMLALLFGLEDELLNAVWTHAEMDVVVTALGREGNDDDDDDDDNDELEKNEVGRDAEDARARRLAARAEREEQRDQRMLDCSQKMQKMRELKTFYRERVTMLRKVRETAREREGRWLDEATNRLTELSGKWIAEAEKRRLEKQLELQKRGAAERARQLRQQLQDARDTVKRKQTEIGRMHAQIRANRKMFEAEVKARAETAKSTIEHLKATMAKHHKMWEKTLNEKKEEMKKLTELHAKQVAELEGELAVMTETAKRRWQWVQSIKIELNNAKNIIESLKLEHQQEHAAWEKERADLSTQLKFHMEQSERRLQHINSLKNEVTLLRVAADQREVEMEKERDVFRAEARSLRWEIWKRDETARRLRTDVDAAFQWFAETLSSLAGAGSDYNERIAANGGIQVLVGLSSAISIDLRRHASRAMGSIAWNGHVDFRVVSRRARDAWSSWLDTVSKGTEWKWRTLTEEQMNAPMVGFAVGLRAAEGVGVKIDLLDGDEIEEIVLPDEPKQRNQENDKKMPDANQRDRTRKETAEGAGTIGSGTGGVRKLLLLKNNMVAHGLTVRKRPRDLAPLEGLVSAQRRDAWKTHEEQSRVLNNPIFSTSTLSSSPSAASLRIAALEVEVVSEAEVQAQVGPNVPIGLALAKAHAALESLVSMCRENDEDLQRNATDTLAVLALQGENRTLLMRLPAMASSLQCLCEREVSPEVQRNAVAAIANIAYRCRANQDAFASCETINALVDLCRESTDVDVIENACLGIANLTWKHEKNSLAVGRAGGIEALVELCNSPRSSEWGCSSVQADAAEALVNATRNDSHENAERIRRFGVRPLILLCASSAVAVQRCAALVLGNVAQNDANRLDIGANGGIDALFLLTESQDYAVQANALWALSNLAWSTANQERIGFHLPSLIQLCTSPDVAVRGNATAALANALFYNENNRQRLRRIENEIHVDRASDAANVNEDNIHPTLSSSSLPSRKDVGTEKTTSEKLEGSNGNKKDNNDEPDDERQRETTEDEDDSHCDTKRKRSNDQQSYGELGKGPEKMSALVLHARGGGLGVLIGLLHDSNPFVQENAARALGTKPFLFFLFFFLFVLPLSQYSFPHDITSFFCFVRPNVRYKSPRLHG